MEPVGQASRARVASRRSAALAGCWGTKEKTSASPNVLGASCRQGARVLQGGTTKKSPATFIGSRLSSLAIRNLHGDRRISRVRRRVPETFYALQTTVWICGRRTDTVRQRGNGQASDVDGCTGSNSPGAHGGP